MKMKMKKSCHAVDVDDDELIMTLAGTETEP